MHPVEHIAFWNTKPEAVNEMARMYDMIADLGPEYKKNLDLLMSWAWQESLSTEIYNSGDC